MFFHQTMFSNLLFCDIVINILNLEGGWYSQNIKTVERLVGSEIIRNIFLIISGRTVLKVRKYLGFDKENALDFFFAHQTAQRIIVIYIFGSLVLNK